MSQVKNVAVAPIRISAQEKKSHEMNAAYLYAALQDYVVSSKGDSRSIERRSVDVPLAAVAEKAGETVRASLEKRVPSLLGKAPLPVETLLFMDALLKRGYKIEIKSAGDVFVDLALTFRGKSEGLSIDVERDSLAFRIEKSAHEETYDRVLKELNTSGILKKYDGVLFGGGSLWTSYTGTGIRA